MAHGRVETTPEQQLAELRRAYERYAALADQLKDSADPQIDAELLRARAQDARRIAHAYEKTIASTAMRMESMHPPRGAEARFGAMALPLSLTLVAALLASGALVAYMRPELIKPLLQRVMPQLAENSAPVTVPVAKIVPVPAAPPPPAIVPALDAPPMPTPRPAQADDKPQLAMAPKPVIAPLKVAPPAPLPIIAPPKQAPAPVAPPAVAKVTAPTPAAKASVPATAPSPRSVAPAVTAPPTSLSNPIIVSPKQTAASPPAAIAKPSAPLVAAPPKQAATPPAAAIAKTPAPPTAASSSPTETITATPATPPSAIVQPLAAPRDVAPLPAPSPLAEPSANAAQAATSTATPANARLVPVMRTHLVPPYPAEAKRAGEQGTTQMQVTIGTDGSISDCRVSATSGSQRLDATACSFVQRYWRWVPPVRDGRPAPATTKVSVIWNLSPGDRP